MAYSLTMDRPGLPVITSHSTTLGAPLGTIATGTDPAYGEGEFIYLKGIDSTVAGSVVTYSANWLTALCAVGSLVPSPVAFAMSACVTGEYGWYQIGGVATAKKAVAGILSAGKAMGVLTTGLAAATGTSKEIFGAAYAGTVASAATSVLVSINRPYVQGRID